MFLLLWGCAVLVFARPVAQTLDNGLQLIIDQTTHIPQVSMQLHFSFEPERYPEGLPHLVEHLLFEMEKDGMLYDHWVEKNRGNSNARTRWTELIVETTVSSSSVEELARWEIWRMTNFCASLKAVNIDNQKMIIVQEMLNQDFRHLGGIPDRIRKAVFSQDPILGAEVMGSVADLEQIGTAELCRFAREVFHPDNARLILAGSVSLRQQEALEEILSVTFGMREKSAQEVPSKPPLYQPSSWFVSSQQDSRLYLIWKAPEYGVSEEIQSDFLLERLISSQTGVLPQYFSQVSGWSENTRGGGWRVIWIDTDDPKQALESVEQILNASEQWISPENIDRFQAQSRGVLARLQLKNKERARLLGECSLIEKGEECFEWEQQRRMVLREKELVSYLQESYSLKQASVLWIGPENQLSGQRLP